MLILLYFRTFKRNRSNALIVPGRYLFHIIQYDFHWCPAQVLSRLCRKRHKKCVFIPVFTNYYSLLFSLSFQHVAASSGSGKADLDKLTSILEAIPPIRYICLDVANGYSEHFVEFVKSVRALFPHHTIMVSVQKGWRGCLAILSRNRAQSLVGRHQKLCGSSINF